jgi:hypothetical protein
VLLFASSVAADPPVATPVVATLYGNERVQVIVAEGSTAPCDSPENRQLYRGFVEPGRPLLLQSPLGCVCVQQSFAPMTSTDWGPSRWECRPQACNAAKVCRPVVDPAIRVALVSRR